MTEEAKKQREEDRVEGKKSLLQKALPPRHFANVLLSSAFEEHDKIR